MGQVIDNVFSNQIRDAENGNLIFIVLGHKIICFSVLNPRNAKIIAAFKLKSWKK